MMIKFGANATGVTTYFVIPQEDQSCGGEKELVSNYLTLNRIAVIVKRTF